MMALNKYRLKHKAKSGHKGALKAQKLLKSPDRLLGVILLGNNFVNIFASSIATIIAMRLMGEAGIALAAGLLTLVVLVFAEVAPKTLAALYPEKIAYPAAYILEPLLKILSPIVWFVNFFANGFLKLFQVKVNHEHDHHLTQEELQTLIDHATGQLPDTYRSMLSSILQLETVTVEDVMIPKQEIYGVNIEQPIEGILKDIQMSRYTRIPIYRGTIDDDLIGILNLRRALPTLMRGEDVTLRDIVKLIRPAYFVPETTSLNIQLGKFNDKKRRMAMIVDEYGDIQGLLTMEDLLEEIVGKLSTDSKSHNDEEVTVNADGSMTFEAGEFIRDLNKEHDFELPTDGPKTLNGLIQEELEALPNVGTCVKIDNYILEVLDTSANSIETIKLIDLSTTDENKEQ